MSGRADVGMMGASAPPCTEVKAGSPVARVDDSDLQLELADNEARLESLLAQQRYQVSNLNRLERLGENLRGNIEAGLSTTTV